MLRRVSKWAVAALAGIAISGFAQTQITGAAGLDAWSVPADPVRYTPNYSTPNAWRSVNPWTRIGVQHAYDTEIGPLTLTAQAQYSPVTGGRIDRLDADLRWSQSTGARMGVLPYRVSWCRAYQASSQWITEPDAFCRYTGLSEIAQGAFGAQAYHSDIMAGWLVDSLVGIYRPMVDAQSKSLGPYLGVGPTRMHTAHGASLNAMHLGTGSQLRLGWLRTAQDQDSSTGGYSRHIRYDTWYLGAEGNITPKLEVRASLSAYIGDQVNPANLYHWDGRSLTLEATYKPAPGHALAIGVSRYKNSTTYAVAPHDQSLTVPSLSLAWRMDLPGTWWAVTQATRSLDNAVTRQGAITDRQGDAFGLRIGRTF